MIGSLLTRMSRRTAFLGFNAALLLLMVLFVIAPMSERFSDRADAIAQDGADLSRQRLLRAHALAVVAGSTQSGALWLPGRDPSTADADLQQVLKTLAAQSGVRFVGVRAVGAGAGGMVTARLDVEGSSSSIGALVRSIETHDPCLFIGALAMRATVVGRGASADTLSAQLSVLGAFKGLTVAREM